MSPVLFYGVLGLVWLAAGLAGGALLATLAKRMHPGLSYRKLWAFYTLLLGLAVAVVFAIGWM